MASWEHAAGLLWPILTDAAKRGELRNYGEVAPAVHTVPIAVGYALGPIQDFCRNEQLPPLTAIIINKGTGFPGPGFSAWDVDDIQNAYKAVFGFNWDVVSNPFVGYGENDSAESLAIGITTSSVSAEEIYAQVKVRGVIQIIFRRLLLETYCSECSICGCTFEEVLEAAHIIPWGKATHSQRLDPSNGLLLCSLHHKLFDSGKIKITSEFRIQYGDMDMKEEPYSDIDKRLTISLHGKKIKLPRNRRHWPALNFLSYRYEMTD